MDCPPLSTVRADLQSVADLAAAFLDSLPTRHASGTKTEAELFQAMDRPFPEIGSPAEVVI